MSEVKILSKSASGLERMIIYEVDGERKLVTAPVSVKTFDQLEAQIKAQYGAKQQAPKVEVKKPTPQPQPVKAAVSPTPTPQPVKAAPQPAPAKVATPQPQPQSKPTAAVKPQPKVVVETKKDLIDGK